MKKPEFPKPRMIREGFLPERDPMDNYRIKKVTTRYQTVRYHPQKKFLGFWVDLDYHPLTYFSRYYTSSWYETYESANEEILDYIKFLNRPKEKVEYLEPKMEQQ